MYKTLSTAAGVALLLGASFALADKIPLSDTQADQVTAGDCVVCGNNTVGYNNGSFNANNSWGYNGNKTAKASTLLVLQPGGATAEQLDRGQPAGLGSATHKWGDG